MYRIVVVLTLISGIACRHKAPPPVVFGGCTTSPLIGPVGHVELVLAATPDSLLADSQGRLVSIARWSSDSLASESQPEPLRFRFTATRPRMNSAGYMTLVDTIGVATPDSGIVRFTLAGPAGSYELSVRVFAGMGLDTTLSIRRGFADTARVLVQAGGLTVCA